MPVEIERPSLPLGLVSDEDRVEDRVVNPVEGDVGRRQWPLGEVFNSLEEIKPGLVKGTIATSVYPAS